MYLAFIFHSYYPYAILILFLTIISTLWVHGSGQSRRQRQPYPGLPEQNPAMTNSLRFPRHSSSFGSVCRYPRASTWAAGTARRATLRLLRTLPWARPKAATNVCHAA
ncbi:hypothetical protein V2G26_019785 [Clonostachys chloroleuca]